MLGVLFRAALVLSALIAVPARAQCEVTGVASMNRLRVYAPPSEPIRTFAVTDLPIAVRPGDTANFRDVRVLAPIAFLARSDGVVPWTVARPASFAGGTLWLTPLVEVEEVIQRDPGVLVVRAQVDDGVWISRARIPCAALALGAAEGRVHGPPWGTPSGARWQLRGDSLWLSVSPGEMAAVRIDAPDGLPSPFVELERRGDAVRVAAHFASGAAVRGWVRRLDLQLAPHQQDEPRAFVRSVPMPPSGQCPRRPRWRGERLAQAQIAAGTAVHTRPDGSSWATIAEPALVTIAWRARSRWVRIVHVPGLRNDARCPELLENAWVLRDAITLRGDANVDPAVE